MIVGQHQLIKLCHGIRLVEVFFAAIGIISLWIGMVRPAKIMGNSTMRPDGAVAVVYRVIGLKVIFVQNIENWDSIPLNTLTEI